MSCSPQFSQDCKNHGPRPVPGTRTKLGVFARSVITAWPICVDNFDFFGTKSLSTRRGYAFANLVQPATHQKHRLYPRIVVTSLPIRRQANNNRNHVSVHETWLRLCQ